MENKYANQIGWSDVHPYEIVRWVSEKTVEIRAMNATLDENWKGKFVPGGFAGRCINQDSQRYEYSSNHSNQIIRMRLRKNGHWYSAYGRHKISDEPYKFYDYNF